jgi:hypothetical protein
VHGVGGKHGQHLPFFDQVTDIHAHLGQAQSTDLGADRRFLPGRDAAVGRQAVGDVGARGSDHSDHQGRLGLIRRRRAGGPGSAAEKDERGKEDSEAQPIGAAVRRHDGVLVVGTAVFSGSVSGGL